MWYASKLDCYEFDTGRNTCKPADAGHLAQVAWDKSTKVGCASNVAATGGLKSICMYSPRGNVGGSNGLKEHIQKCRKNIRYKYMTGRSRCCHGNKLLCKNGKCGWKYDSAVNKKGCPADPDCKVHKACKRSGEAMLKVRWWRKIKRAVMGPAEVAEEP